MKLADRFYRGEGLGAMSVHYWIHSPNGERVGEVSHVRNKEYLFVVSRDARVHKALNRTPLSDTGT